MLFLLPFAVAVRKFSIPCPPSESLSTAMMATYTTQTSLASLVNSAANQINSNWTQKVRLTYELKSNEVS